MKTLNFSSEILTKIKNSISCIKNTMSVVDIQCYLINLDTNERIDLPHKTPVTLGRNKTTNIKDVGLSRKQIVCFSDLKENKVVLKPVGKSTSGCNGFALTKNLMYTIGFKDIIELSMGNHKFQVHFDPPPKRMEEPSTSTTEESKTKKPKLDFPIFNTQKAKTISDNTSSGTWEEVDNRELLIYSPPSCEARSKIAGFDIDGTIIRTKSGSRFPKTSDDWTWNIPSIQKHLQRLVDDEYKIVFFTNQSGVGSDLSRIKDFKRKVENIVEALHLPVQVFISLGKKMYRKPRIGMWNVLTQDKNDGVSVDINNSFYVGDAAGREKNWAPKKNRDHSCADRLFAINIGLKFYTPEEYFLNQKPVPYKMPEFDPRVDTSHLKYPDLSYDKLNVVLMVGGPGSGKSKFVTDILIPEGYVHVSRDKLGSWQKCVKAMEESLEKNRNVVIDNTNVDKETRQRFIKAAKKYNADVRCFVMETTLGQMRHNNKFREMTDKSHALVSDIIIFSYRKNYQAPDVSEGYSQVLQIPLIVNFSDEALEKLYRSFLLD